MTVVVVGHAGYHIATYRLDKTTDPFAEFSVEGLFAVREGFFEAVNELDRRLSVVAGYYGHEVVASPLEGEG